VTDGQSDLAQLNAEYRLNSQWTAKFDYSYSQDKYSDNQARVMAYDAKTGNLTRRVDATQGSTQRMHSTRADLQGNVDIAGFYNEILTGVSYENYDLLRTDMIRCKNVKGFQYLPSGLRQTRQVYNRLRRRQRPDAQAGELLRLRAGCAVPDR
jgi:iron complex outermembrane receptor protein